MSERLKGKKVAILAADGIEQVELTAPKEALEAEGADTFIISPNPGEIRGMQDDEQGDRFDVDVDLEFALAEEFDALLIPGSFANPHELRSSDDAMQFVRDFFNTGKPVAAICKASCVLVDAGVVSGRTLTSWPAIKTEVRNAKGNWLDEEVVIDRGLVTSRRPSDLPVFNEAMVHVFSQPRREIGTHFVQLVS